MAWEEWEQLKSEAAARHSAKMQLNSVPVEPGSSSGRCDACSARETELA